MASQAIFDFGWVYPDAIDFDLLVLTPENLERSIGQKSSNVPSPIKQVFAVLAMRILKKNCHRGCPVLEVAKRAERCTNDNFPGLADAARNVIAHHKPLATWKRKPDRHYCWQRAARDLVGKLGQRCFSRAIEIYDLSLRVLRPKAFDQRSFQRFSREEHPSQRRQARALGCIHEPRSQ